MSRRQYLILLHKNVSIQRILKKKKNYTAKQAVKETQKYLTENLQTKKWESLLIVVVWLSPSNVDCFKESCCPTRTSLARLIFQY